MRVLELAKYAETKTVFMSHSRLDTNGMNFFNRAFSSTPNRCFWYSFEIPEPPHANTLTNQIKQSSSVFVVLSEPMAERPQTRSWVGFEAGVAASLKKSVIVFERYDEFINIPVPGATAYIQRPPTLKDASLEASYPYLDVCDNGGTSLKFHRQSLGSMFTHKLVECKNKDCRAKYALVLWHGQETWHCPVCRKSMKLNDKDE